MSNYQKKPPTCIFCNREIEPGKPGHEFWYDEALGKLVNAHEECQI